MSRQAVQDDDIGGAVGGFHFGKHPSGIHTLIFHIVLALQIGVHRHQVILPVYLHTMPGVKEQAHVITEQRPSENIDGLFRLLLIDILVAHDLESKPL